MELGSWKGGGDEEKAGILEAERRKGFSEERVTENHANRPRRRPETPPLELAV